MITFVHWLVILSAAINITGSVFYIKNTIQGTTKPNKVTWLMWGAAPMIGTFAALSLHSDPWVTSRIFLAGFFPLVVFIASFINPKSYWKITKFDVACGLLSLVALIIWLFMGQARTAILVAALADLFAALPTIIKCWKYPETETGFTFALGLLSVLLILPSIQVWNIENASFQVYLLVVNIILVFSVYRKHLSFINPLKN